jgi:5-methylcytosine-specific restriction endonuclease McrA
MDVFAELTLMFMRIACIFLMVLAAPAVGEPPSPGTDCFAASSDETSPCLEAQSSYEPVVLAGRGKRFTTQQKKIVKKENADANEGQNRCEECRVETVPAKKHEKGVTPPPNETHVDHKIPSAKGGPSEVDNGQVLCRDCNLKKGDKDPRGQ